MYKGKDIEGRSIPISNYILFFWAKTGWQKTSLHKKNL
jgi:hypothetical protein